jgi:phosphoribosyl 1,2-cyclic phosphodiesterase
VTAREIPHKGGRTFGYRITSGGSTLSYLSDHCPTLVGEGPEGRGEYHEAAVALTSGCDLLFHDSQYTDEELPERASFGHCSTGYAVGLAEHAGVGRLMLYHHDPARTDDEIDQLVAKYQDAKVPVSAAAEGAVIDLP